MTIEHCTQEIDGVGYEYDPARLVCRGSRVASCHPVVPESRGGVR